MDALPFSKDLKVGHSGPDTRVVGDYTLGKTLYSDSFGKTKLASHRITGEKFSVKIVPRHRSSTSISLEDAPLSPTAGDPITRRDFTRELRTVREASINMLLHHPHICSMREMIFQNSHFYLVFEYVEGGSMLDYIIKNGRLRERTARKFARQIGSALEYCHKNNVVHRDLKIENILVPESLQIKITGFGLSNLFSPQSHLSTQCGSSYFAAPELLQGKFYVGPEVDVWSFGIVLYALVCGKVPFDDKSMSGLHAKILNGVVEYPVWLTSDCRQLLSRMLLVDPAARATIAEVIAHPWMVLGFPGRPSASLEPRDPLSPITTGESAYVETPFDKEVIRRMTSLDLGFGTEAEIEGKMWEILKSDRYRETVTTWEKGRDSFNPTAPVSEPGKSIRGFIQSATKILSPCTSSGDRQGSTFEDSSSTTSTLVPRTGDEVVFDPCYGFDPLLSIYFLVKEKVERERTEVS